MVHICRQAVQDMMQLHRCHEIVRQMYAEVPEDLDLLGDSHRRADTDDVTAKPSKPWSWSTYRKESACDSVKQNEIVIFKKSLSFNLIILFKKGIAIHRAASSAGPHWPLEVKTFKLQTLGFFILNSFDTI